MTKIIRIKLKNSKSTSKFIEYNTKENIFLDDKEAEMISFINTTAWSPNFVAKLKGENKSVIFNLNKTKITGDYLIFTEGEL